jgi:Fe-S cluster assembly ATP-binding protein
MIKLLSIKNLTVEVDGIEVIKNLDFDMTKGEVIALLGPNASGKTTLASVIAGDPRYKIKKGEIKFNGKSINKLKIEERVDLGIVLSYQNPPVIEGLKLSDFLEEISRNKNSYIIEKLLNRDVNKGFSGGEKKMSELMQLTSLKPKLVILDEVDSGLDIKKVGEVAEVINKYFINKGIAVLIITHHGEILDLLKPNSASIMIDGLIVGRNEDYKNVLKTIKKFDYEKCRKCTKFLQER